MSTTPDLILVMQVADFEHQHAVDEALLQLHIRGESYIRLSEEGVDVLVDKGRLKDPLTEIALREIAEAFQAAHRAKARPRNAVARAAVALKWSGRAK